MGRQLAVTLYRALLREARHQLERRFPGLAFHLRAPVSRDAGSYNPHAAVGAAYELQSLEELVPGLLVRPEPEQLPLTHQALRRLIRANFEANGDAGRDLGGGLSPLDQGFAALRALPLQAYLEACSSSSTTDGVRIEATGCHTHSEPTPQRPGLLQGPEHWFSYRIRITNLRQQPVRVLGRGWVITNSRDELEGLVKLAADNGVVGQTPVIPPLGCFEYVSRTPLRSECGRMAGQLLVDLMAAPPGAGGGRDGRGRRGGGGGGGEEEEEEGAAPQRVAMPVAPFRLQTMDAAGGRARRAGGGDGGSSSGEDEA